MHAYLSSAQINAHHDRIDYRKEDLRPLGWADDYNVVCPCLKYLADLPQEFSLIVEHFQAQYLVVVIVAFRKIGAVSGAHVNPLVAKRAHFISILEGVKSQKKRILVLAVCVQAQGSVIFPHVKSSSRVDSFGEIGENVHNDLAMQSMWPAELANH